MPHLLAASAAALFLSVSGVNPPDYSEKSLCDLYAGARCHQTSCAPDGKARCAEVSSQCRGRSNEGRVSPEQAETVVACAKALLSVPCGGPHPSQCDGVNMR